MPNSGDKQVFHLESSTEPRQSLGGTRAKLGAGGKGFRKK